MRPGVFVIDLDECLVYFDEFCSCDKVPKYYVREYAIKFLELLRQLNERNILILWSAGKEPYVTDVLYQSNLGTHFKYSLNREHYKASFKKFGIPKSAEYIAAYLKARHFSDEYSAIKEFDFYLIDDKATVNGGGTYFSEINVLPYNSAIVNKELKTNYRDNTLEELAGYFFDKVFYHVLR